MSGSDPVGEHAFSYSWCCCTWGLDFRQYLEVATGSGTLRREHNFSSSSTILLQVSCVQVSGLLVRTTYIRRRSVHTVGALLSLAGLHVLAFRLNAFICHLVNKVLHLSVQRHNIRFRQYLKYLSLEFWYSLRFIQPSSLHLSTKRQRQYAVRFAQSQEPKIIWRH